MVFKATTDRKVAVRSSDDGCRRDILAHLTSGKATRVSPRSGVIPRRREEARVNQRIPEVSIPLVSNKRRGREYILQTHICLDNMNVFKQNVLHRNIVRMVGEGQYWTVVIRTVYSSAI